MNCFKCAYPIPYSKTPSKCSVCHTEQPGPRTQKGLGIEALRNEFDNVVTVSGYVQSEEFLPKHGYPFFARPAPSTPKHGYIDSRLVKNLPQAAALLKEVLADDPQGELIMCGKYSNVSHNMVWTPGLLSIGTGNAGATSGTDQTTIPLAYSNCPIPQNILNKAKISEQPFVEAIYSADFGTVLTQLRNGPKTPQLFDGDYVPVQTVVQEVLTVDPDGYKDRGWELRIEQAIGKTGVVVWHPGGSINDHFSIHAFTANFPIIFSDKEPSVGDVLEPTVSGKRAFNAQEMLKGVVAGEFTRIDDDNWDDSVRLILMILHNAPVMVGQYSKWIGIASSMMLRLGCTALRGEARHFGTEDSKKSREEVYNSYLNRKLPFHQAGVNRLINIFRYGKWKSAGFGGMKWAACGASTLSLFNAVRGLAANPTEETAAQLVRALNVTVNQAHNGGWWLNKFTSQDAFSEMQVGDLTRVLAISKTIHEADVTFKKLTQYAYDTRIKRINQWSDLTLSPPRTVGAKLTVSKSNDNVTLTISARLLGKRARPISATITDPSLRDKDQAKTLKLIESADGYRLERRTEDGQSSVVWAEPPLMDKALKMKAF